MLREWRWTCAAVVASWMGGIVQAQMTERVSLSSAGTEVGGGTYSARISADGRFVAFEDSGANVVPGDTNSKVDIFVRDRELGTTERVSVSSSGVQANDYSLRPSLSADGRFVVFQSLATNLVAGDTNGVQDIFVRDRWNGTTERVSVATGGAQADGGCGEPAISGDGRFAAFDSWSSTLVPGYGNFSQTFVRDLQLQTTVCVSTSASGVEGDSWSAGPSLSADGRFVTFYSAASNLVAGDTGGWQDVFLRDQQLGTIERVSTGLGGAQADGHSRSPSLSADGRFVAFDSEATNLVTGDTNAQGDVFVLDRQSGAITRASLFAGGFQGWGGYPSISADGRFVAFSGGQSPAQTRIYVRDLQAGDAELVSVSSGGQVALGLSRLPSISADGRYVEFTSSASNLVAGDTNGSDDAFVRDRGGPPPVAFCFGDGSAVACPCGNNGVPGAGCENSYGTGGAILSAVGARSLSADTLVFDSTGELFSASTILLQGTATIAAANFGDGLRCVGGALKRLYIVAAFGGLASAPAPGDQTVSARSAARGDVLTPGAVRYYQAYYRDPAPGFCPSPAGNAWNISSGLSVTWGG